MKKILGLFLFIIIISCGNEKRINISGEIKNNKNNYVYLNKLDVYKSVALDSVKTDKKGEFQFKIESEDPGFYQIKLKTGGFVNLLLYPGDNIRFISDASKDIFHSEIRGSEESNKIFELNKKLAVTIQKVDSLENLLKNASDPETREQILIERERCIKEHKYYSKGFILENRNSLASLVALYQEIDDNMYLFYSLQDMQFYKLVYDSLNVKYPQLKHVRILEENYNRMMNSYITQKYLNKADNVSGLPDIKLPDINNREVNLSSLRGKTVLLNFWATWHNESASQIQQLKRIYDRYKNKNFEIYNIAFDYSVERWEKVSRFEEINWINVCDTTYPNSVVVSYYNVRNLPANYLLNAEQNEILGKNLTIRELEQKLNLLLK